MKIELSPKQCDYIKSADRRFNFKIGATQCGKTFVDVQYVIPHRITERRGKSGLNLLLGVTKETIERNVLEPMRDIWGSVLVGEINNRNWAMLFGEKVYCLGAEKVSQVAKLRGAKFKYVYIDEAVDMNEEVFQLLKSRMSLEYSVCDATGNPSYPEHFIKEFINSGADIYSQHWTLYDNPFLPRSYIHNLEIEYAGTVYYDRYILGEWARAEGLIYPSFPDAFGKPGDDVYSAYVLSADYGTMNAFAGILWGRNEEGVWWALREYYYSGRDTGRPKTDEEYYDDLEDFVADIEFSERPVLVIDPSAASFITLCRRRGLFRVRSADNKVLDGVRETNSAMRTGKIRFSSTLKECKNEFGGYVWDTSEKTDKPTQVNDHLMDAVRYFVRTMRVMKPRTEYKSIFEG